MQRLGEKQKQNKTGMKFFKKKPQISVATIPHQIYLYLQQMAMITENHSWTQCRKENVLGSPDPVNTGTVQILHLWVNKHHKRWLKNCKNQIIRKPFFLKQSFLQRLHEQDWNNGTPIAMLTWKRVNFTVFHLQMKNYRKLRTAGRKRIKLCKR